MDEIKATPLDRVALHRFQERVAALTTEIKVERELAPPWPGRKKQPPAMRPGVALGIPHLWPRLQTGKER